MATSKQEIEQHELKMKIQQMSLDENSEKLFDGLVNDKPEPKNSNKIELSGFDGLKGFEKNDQTEDKQPEDQLMKNVEYLFENHSDIFNVTPPNAKAEDKLKPLPRYPLKPVETQ